MTDPTRDRAGLVVFTDLDGTLLDHDSYSWAPARPALAALAAAGIPLVLASSKTAAEIAALHRALGLGDTPAIVENGAAIFEPGATLDGGNGYDRLRRALDAALPELRRYFKGFGDMTVGDVAQETGLSPDAAALARQRAHSEPGLWSGDGEQRADFLDALRARGITAREGGRFLTLSFGATKADRMAEIMARFAPGHSLALGDAANDVEMLEAADHAVIVRNDHAAPIPPLAGETSGRITRTTRPGPEGWNDAVLRFLATKSAGEAQSWHG